MPKEDSPNQFGVYTLRTGSYGFGRYRFTPNAAVEVPAQVAAALADSPVKFLATAEKAAEEIAKLKAKSAPKPK